MDTLVKQALRVRICNSHECCLSMHALDRFLFLVLPVLVEPGARRCVFGRSNDVSSCFSRRSSTFVEAGVAAALGTEMTVMEMSLPTFMDRASAVIAISVHDAVYGRVKDFR